MGIQIQKELDWNNVLNDALDRVYTCPKTKETYRNDITTMRNLHYAYNERGLKHIFQISFSSPYDLGNTLLPWHNHGDLPLVNKGGELLQDVAKKRMKNIKIRVIDSAKCEAVFNRLEQEYINNKTYGTLFFSTQPLDAFPSYVVDTQGFPENGQPSHRLLNIDGVHRSILAYNEAQHTGLVPKFDAIVACENFGELERLL